MPFDKIEKFSDHAHYKSVLKAELQKVAATPVKYHYFEKFKFEGGGKDGEPFVAVGIYNTAFIDALKNTGAVYKARGRMAQAEGQPLKFTVEHGTLKEATLNLALKQGSAPKASLAESLGSDEGKAELAREPMASSEVVRNPGGQGAGNDGAWAKAKATREKLHAVMQALGQKLPSSTRDQLRLALFAAFDKAVQDKDLTAAERALGDARMRLDSFAGQAKSDKEKALDTEVASQISAHDKAEKDVADLPASIDEHAKTVTSLTRAISGLNGIDQKKRGASWQKDLDAKTALLDTAKTRAQRLATRLANAKELMKEDSATAAALRAKLMALLTELKQAQDEVERLSTDPDRSNSGPGKVSASPGLAQAKEALAGKMAPIAEKHVKHAALITEVVRRTRALRARYEAIRSALDAKCQEPLEALEQEVQPLIQNPPPDDAFHAPLIARCETFAKWLDARERLLKLVKSRDVETSYKSLLQKNPKDGLLTNAKKRLDDMVSGTVTPTDKQIHSMMVIVAPKGDAEFLERSKAKDSSLDEAAKWGDTSLKNGLLRQVWKNSAKAAKGGDQPETIKGLTLESVEAAIEAWQAARYDAPLAVSNMHVPGGGRPQYKADKNVTRRDIQANFISYWNGKQINQHVEIVTCGQGDLYHSDGRVVEALINKLVDAGRMNRS